MANTKMIGALLGTLALGSASIAFAEDAPAAKTEKGKKMKKGDGDKKGGEKSCGGDKKGGDKSCSGDKGCSGKAK